MDPKLFLPLVDNKILPKCVRKFFRFGVAELKHSVYDDEIEKHPKIVKENLSQYHNGKKQESEDLYASNDEKKRLYKGIDINTAI